MKSPLGEALGRWWASRGASAKSVWVMAAIIVGANLIARVVTRIVSPDTQDDVVPGLIVHAVTAIAAGLLGFWAARRWRVGVVAGRFYFITLLAGIVVAFVGPSVSGGSPDTNIWFLLGRILLNQAVAALGVFLGTLIAVAFGLDPLTRAYAARSTSRRSHPQ